ncbi:MAG: hypothetical protein ING10_11215 [Roseomonas sp.]|nr:hypothetical protein [Roseomonas sp.]
MTDLGNGGGQHPATQGQGTGGGTPRRKASFQENLKQAAERAALWWVAHVAEALLIAGILLILLGMALGLLPDTEFSGLFNAIHDGRRD